jgi:hypothetical protein
MLEKAARNRDYIEKRESEQNTKCLEKASRKQEKQDERERGT